MKHLLAENMLRFGTKNLSESELEHLQEQIKLGSKSGWFRVFGRDAKTGEFTPEDVPDYEIRGWVKDPDKWVKMGAPKLSSGEVIGVQIDGNMTNITPTYQKMMTLMSDQSKSNWMALLQDPENYMYGIGAIAYFNDTNPTDKWTDIIVGSQEFIFTEKKRIDDEGSESANSDYAFPTAFPMQASPNSEFFDNNQSTLKQLFKDEVQKYIDTINAAGKAAGMEDPQFFVYSMNVQTSASRLRNQKQAANKTWLQLSTERCQTAYNYLRQELEAQPNFTVGTSPNGEVQTSITLNPKGENGDGTSGPDPANKFTFRGGNTVTGMRYSNDGKTPLTGPDDKRFKGTYGKLLTTMEESDQYRYLIAEIEIVVGESKSKPTAPDETPGEPGPDSKQIKTKTYNIEFYRPPAGLRLPWWYPTIRVKFKKMSTPNWWKKFKNKMNKTKKPKRTTKCFY